MVNFSMPATRLSSISTLGICGGQERVDLLAASLKELGRAFGWPVALALDGLDPLKEAYLYYEPADDEFVFLSGDGLGPEPLPG